MTTKEEKFCNLYIKLGSGSQAYRDAYGKPDLKPSQASTKAYELLQKGYISETIEILRKEEKQEHKIDREFIIKGYLEIINDTNHVFKLADLENADSDASKRFYKLKELTSNADKIRAMENLAKMLGMNAPKKIDVNITSFKTNWGE